MARQKELNEVSSANRLNTSKEGWFWDDETKLWHMKVDFGEASEMTTRSFSIFA
jgi:hypothetical protein